jgi:hypothetical protein
MVNLVMDNGGYFIINYCWPYYHRLLIFILL